MKRTLRVLCISLALCAALCMTALAADYEDIARELSAVGVFKGTGSGFDLDRAPTRAEAAIMLVRRYGAEEQAIADLSAAPMTEKMTLYRAVQTVQPAAAGEAVALDLGLDYTIRYDAAGLEDLTMEAATTGHFAFKGEGEDFQAVYELAISTEGVVMGTGLWIRDGWTYMSMDMSGIPLMQVKYPTNDEDIASLPTTDSMDSVSMAELAAVKSITAEKQDGNTVYTIVYSGNAAVLTESATEAFYDNAPEGTVLNNMTFDNVVMTNTVDKAGMATGHEVVYVVTADTLVTLDDGTQVPLKMVMDYVMTIDVTARGRGVKITFPDLSAFQEIDPSMLED